MGQAAAHRVVELVSVPVVASVVAAAIASAGSLLAVVVVVDRWSALPLEEAPLLQEVRFWVASPVALWWAWIFCFRHRTASCAGLRPAAYRRWPPGPNQII